MQHAKLYRPIVVAVTSALILAGAAAPALTNVVANILTPDEASMTIAHPDFPVELKVVTGDGSGGGAGTCGSGC